MDYGNLEAMLTPKNPYSQSPALWKVLTPFIQYLVNILLSQIGLSLFCSVSVLTASLLQLPSLLKGHDILLPGYPQGTSTPL